MAVLSHSHTSKKPQTSKNPTKKTVSVLVCVHYLWSCGWAPWKKAWLHLIYLPTSDNSGKISQELQHSQLFLAAEMLQSLHQTLSSTSMSFFTGHPEGKTILQVWPHQCLTEGMDQPLDLLTMILLTQLRILLTFFAMGVHLAHIHPGACQDLSCQAASQSLSPQQILVPLPPQVHRTLHSSFLSSRRFLPPTSPACPGSPGWQHSPYGHQPLLPVLCLLGEYSAPSSE